MDKSPQFKPTKTFLTSEFRSKNNKLFLKQLFLDNVLKLPHDRRYCEPRFTLHLDVKGYVNFRKEYVSDMDTTGYTTATRLLENYAHWERLMKSTWFVEAKEEWDREVEAKRRSLAERALKRVLLDEDATRTERTTAAKAVLALEKKAVTKKETVRGRPSNEEVKGELKRATRKEKDILEDMKRIQKATKYNKVLDGDV